MRSKRAIGGCRGLSRATSELLERRRFLAAHITGNPTVYATIQDAVDAAVAGNTITVDAGTYPEQVVIFKQLTIQGAQAGVDGRSNARGTSESIVTGLDLGGGVRSYAFRISASNVVIDGFTVQGETSQADATGAGIVISPSQAGTHIVNNIIQNNVAGLFLANNSTTTAALIQYNLFRANNNEGENGGRGIYTNGGLSGRLLTNVIIDSHALVDNRGGPLLTSGVEAAIALQSRTLNSQNNIHITNNMFDRNGKALLAYNADL